MRKLITIPIAILFFSCNSINQKENYPIQSFCNKLILIKSDSISTDISKEILNLSKETVFQIKEDETDRSKNVFFNNFYITVGVENGYKALLFKSNNLIFLFDYQLFILNGQNKKGYKLPSIRTSSGSLKSLFCFKNKLIYHLTELYDAHYERDLYIIVDNDLNTILSFAVPSMQETTGAPIQEFLYQSKNTLTENKDGNLVIKMKITITKDEKDKQDFSIEIPYDEKSGTFIDLQKILPLVSPDIPISDTENIVIQKLFKE